MIGQLYFHSNKKERLELFPEHIRNAHVPSAASKRKRRDSPPPITKKRTTNLWGTNCSSNWTKPARCKLSKTRTARPRVPTCAGARLAGDDDDDDWCSGGMSSFNDISFLNGDFEADAALLEAAGITF